MPSQISFHGANDATSGSAAGTGSSVVSLSGTGSLYVGGFGANTKGFDNRQTDIGTVGIKAVVNLSGGTLGAIANWTSDANTNFALVSGNSTIKAASAADVAHDISIAGVVTGSGALTKTGGGKLILSNSANALLGNINIVGGTLSLSNNNTIGDGSNISILTGGIFDLNFVGTDTVNSLSLDNTFQAVGLWGAQGNPGATFTSPLLTGTGLLNVTSAVPEPRTWVMLGGGLALVLALRRRARIS